MNDTETSEYLTGNEMTAFPFKEDAGGLVPEGNPAVHGSAAALTRDCLLDAVMTIPAPYLGQIYLKNIVSNAGSYVFNFGTISTVLKSVTVTLPCPARRVLASMEDSSRITIRLVAGSGLSAYLLGISGTDDFGVSLPMETAAVEFTPYKLLALQVGDQLVSGNIGFKEGWNTQIDAVPGQPSQLTLQAGAGLGMGKHPCVETPAVSYIARINGQGCDNDGAFSLVPGEDGCYRTMEYPEYNTIALFNDCVQCCTCQAYADLVTRIADLYARAKVAKKKLLDAAIALNEDVTTWNVDITPKMFQLTLDGYVTLGNTFIESGRSPNYASIIVVVRNPGMHKAENVIIGVVKPSELTVLHRVYFDDKGQHIGENSGDTVVVDIEPGHFYKLIWLIKAPYPQHVNGDFTFTLNYDTLNLTKTVTVVS